MTKLDFVNKFFEVTGRSKKDSAEAVDSFIDILMDAVAVGEKVSFIGFGSFEIKSRAAHNGVNPRTKESIVIPASKRPCFSASKAFKEKCNG